MTGVAISAGTAWLALRGVDWPNIVQALRQAALPPLLGSFAAAAGLRLLLSLRSVVLFDPLWPSDLRFGSKVNSQVSSHFIAMLGNTLLPFRAGEIMRGSYLSWNGRIPFESCLGPLAIERMLDLLFMLLCLFASVSLTAGKIPATPAIALLAAGATVAFSAFVIVGRAPHFGRRVVHVLSRPLGRRGRLFAFNTYEKTVKGFGALASTRKAFLTVWLTVGAWSLGMLGIHLWLVSFDLTLPWYAPIVLQASIAFGTAIPSSVAFLGTYHLAVVFGLSVFGIEKQAAVAVAVVGHAVAIIPWMAIGGAWLSLLFARGDKHRPPDPLPAA